MIGMYSNFEGCIEQSIYILGFTGENLTTVIHLVNDWQIKVVLLDESLHDVKDGLSSICNRKCRQDMHQRTHDEFLLDLAILFSHVTVQTEDHII